MGRRLLVSKLGTMMLEGRFVHHFQVLPNYLGAKLAEEVQRDWLGFENHLDLLLLDWEPM